MVFVILNFATITSGWCITSRKSETLTGNRLTINLESDYGKEYRTNTLDFECLILIAPIEVTFFYQIEMQIKNPDLYFNNDYRRKNV